MSATGSTLKLESKGGALPFLPKRITLPTMTEAVQSCRGCDLYKDATQAVMGAGPVSARIVFVGEQPGDQEDLAGLPFVGGAGKMLDKALIEVGMERKETYVTNAVKHFKFVRRGKKRLHKKPSAGEAEACRPWLEAEIKLIKPKLVVCLGATAAQSLLGSSFRLTQHRGEVLPFTWAPSIMATIHPSAILRAPDHAARAAAYQSFVGDLGMAKKYIGLK